MAYALPRKPGWGAPIVGQRHTYRAATTAVLVPAVTVDIPWFTIGGSASKLVRLQRIQISGLTLTAVAYLNISLGKYSTAASGGTSSGLVRVPLNSSSPAATIATPLVFTAVPTPGTKVGDVATRRFMGQSTTAAAAGIPQLIDFDFRNVGEPSPIMLRGVAEELGLYWETAPATTPSLHLEVEWTEEED